MPADDRDAAPLWDMLQAARLADELIGGSSREQYLADRKLQLAIERLLEILGEAARRVSEPTKTLLPRVPWRSIVGLRNVIAHQYGEIQHDRIWILLQRDLRGLVRSLEGAVPEPPKP